MINLIKVKEIVTAHFILTLYFSTLAFLMILGLFFIEIPKDNSQQLHMILGIVAGWVTSAVSYYFGTTAKRELKDNQYEDINKRTD